MVKLKSELKTIGKRQVYQIGGWEGLLAPARDFVNEDWLSGVEKCPPIKCRLSDYLSLAG